MLQPTVHILTKYLYDREMTNFCTYFPLYFICTQLLCFMCVQQPYVFQQQLNGNVYTMGLQTVVYSHTCKLCTYNKNVTINYAVMYATYCYSFTCGPRTSPQ